MGKKIKSHCPGTCAAHRQSLYWGEWWLRSSERACGWGAPRFSLLCL